MIDLRRPDPLTLRMACAVQQVSTLNSYQSLEWVFESYGDIRRMASFKKLDLVRAAAHLWQLDLDH